MGGGLAYLFVVCWVFVLWFMLYFLVFFVCYIYFLVEVRVFRVIWKFFGSVC